MSFDVLKKYVQTGHDYEIAPTNLELEKEKNV